MNMREIKGMEIAKNSNIRKTSSGWLVPSQSTSKTYTVRENEHGLYCSCPDCEIRRTKRCKHTIAIETLLQEEIDTQGNRTVTKAVRITYSQDWSNYTKAQNSEVRFFNELLKDLVKSVPEPIQTFGRPRLSLQETLFCAIEKVYSGLSSRRAWSLYMNAQEKQQIGKAPNYNSINIALNKREITPILQGLLSLSAMPLKSVEEKFAVDSSGFSTNQFNQYAVEKYGTKKHHKWLKGHILVGTKTNVIASARITDEFGGDSPQFEPMVTEAYENGFAMQEVMADKAYSSRANYEVVKKNGGTAYIPFKSNVTGKARGSLIWRKMWHMFEFKREEFLQKYHARSNVETAFMMVKAKFGEKLKSKNQTAQKNELLCKFIAHNIVVLIHEVHELGVNPEFSL